MKGHAEKCVECYGALTHKSVEQLSTLSTHCMDDHPFAKKDIEIVEVSLSTCVLKLYLHAYTSHESVDQTSYGQSVRWLELSQKWTESVRQEVGETDQLLSMHFRSSTVLRCRKSKKVNASLVHAPRRRLCWRTVKFKVNIRWNASFIW